MNSAHILKHILTPLHKQCNQNHDHYNKGINRYRYSYSLTRGSHSLSHLKRYGRDSSKSKLLLCLQKRFKIFIFTAALKRDGKI